MAQFDIEDVPLAIRGMAPCLLLLLICILEYCTSCRNDVKKLCSTKEGRKLYKQCFMANLINIGILAVVTYDIAVVYCCCKSSSSNLENNNNNFMEATLLIERIRKGCGILLIQGLLYYAIHRCYHEVSGLFWVHRFHHKFNDIILPSSANAVSITEFITAYSFPLLAGIYLTKSDELTAIIASAISSVHNVFIHTPWMNHDHNDNNESKSIYHWIFVSATDHFHHHREWQGNYAAPIIHIDRILQKTGNVFSEKKEKR